jgi:hypothetical protein
MLHLDILPFWNVVCIFLIYLIIMSNWITTWEMIFWGRYFWMDCWIYFFSIRLKPL